MDKEISELRGEPFKYEILRCTACGREPYNIKHKKVKEKRCCREFQQMCEVDIHPKPYSTSIAHAMELLPDIINAGCYMTVQESIERDGISITFVQNTQIIHQASGPDMDELLSKAIAEAWLKLEKGEK